MLFVLMVLVGLMYFTQSVDGCMCMPEHAQSLYCKADYGKLRV